MFNLFKKKDNEEDELKKDETSTEKDENTSEEDSKKDDKTEEKTDENKVEEKATNNINVEVKTTIPATPIDPAISINPTNPVQQNIQVPQTPVASQSMQRSTGLRMHFVEDDKSDEKETKEEENEEKVQKKPNPNRIRRRVRRREKSRFLEFQSINRVAMCLIIFGVVTLLLTITFLLISLRATRNGSIMYLGDIVHTKSKVNNYSLVTLSAETGVQLNKTSASRNRTTTSKRYDEFIRIKVQIKNKSRSILAFNSYNDLYLVDASYTFISQCLTAEELTGYQVTDALPSTLQPKTITEGYIYCPTNITTLPILQIVSATENSQISSDGQISGTANNYYINLGKSNNISKLR